jgi:hypothetical protein
MNVKVGIILDDLGGGVDACSAHSATPSVGTEHCMAWEREGGHTCVRPSTEQRGREREGAVAVGGRGRALLQWEGEGGHVCEPLLVARVELACTTHTVQRRQNVHCALDAVWMRALCEQ